MRDIDANSYTGRRRLLVIKGILQPTGDSIYCKTYTHCVDYPYLICTPGSG